MKVQAEITLTPAQLAEAFADLYTDQQAEFFVAVAAAAKRWTAQDQGFRQWFEVGRALRMDVSPDAAMARALLTEIHEGTKGGSA